MSIGNHSIDSHLKIFRAALDDPPQEESPKKGKCPETTTSTIVVEGPSGRPEDRYFIVSSLEKPCLIETTKLEKLTIASSLTKATPHTLFLESRDTGVESQKRADESLAYFKKDHASGFVSTAEINELEKKMGKQMLKRLSKDKRPVNHWVRKKAKKLEALSDETGHKVPYLDYVKELSREYKELNS